MYFFKKCLSDPALPKAIAKYFSLSAWFSLLNSTIILAGHVVGPCKSSTGGAQGWRVSSLSPSLSN